MTDNEIIKALECCKELICKDCPIFPNSTPILLCKSRLEIEALDLIKRQQADMIELRIFAEKKNDKLNSVIDCQKAEIERNRRIIKGHETVIEVLEKSLKEEKAETVRLFAEELKRCTVSAQIGKYNYNITTTFGIDDIAERFIRRLSNG